MWFGDELEKEEAEAPFSKDSYINKFSHLKEFQIFSLCILEMSAKVIFRQAI